jgi:hypothetical protein
MSIPEKKQRAAISQHAADQAVFCSARRLFFITWGHRFALNKISK